MELKQYAAEHIIENGKHYPEKWVNRSFIEVADAKRALDAEREKVKGLKKRLAEEHPGLDEVCDERDALRAQLAAGRPTPRRNAMTDASGQRQRAEAHVSYMFGVPDYEIATGEYENAIQATLKLQATARQEALREASDLIKLMPMLTAHNVAAVLDRLAREGVRG